MRHFLTARRAGVPAVAAVLGALVATPAFADVTVSPGSAVQGSGENLTFHVTNDGNKPIGTVKLTWPKDTPVAEVYPLSVNDWAPKIAMQTLSTPLLTIHDGSPVTEVPESITWIAMPGRQLQPGKAADLTVAIGPLPTLSSMPFTLVTTYTDGKPGPAMPPAAVALTAAAAGQAPAGHSGHSGTDATGTGTTGDNAAEDATFADAVADATRGPSIWSISGWVVAGLILLGGLFYVLRGRHRAEEDDEPEDDEKSEVSAAETTDPEPVSAGKWSLRG